MATRYSGNVKVTIVYDDSSDQYKAVVSAGGRRKTVYVGPPRFLRVAVDSKEGYDGAARAAISFAMDEGLDASPEYDAEGAEYMLRRSRRSQR